MEIPWNSIIRVGQASMMDTDLFNVSWILGRFCNYKCSYCWPYARSDQQDYQSLELYKHTVDEIKRQSHLNKFTRFHWSFSGGEPTAYKELLQLISYINGDTNYQSIHMTTNLSPGSKWWGLWLTATRNFQRRSLTASYHAEFANEQEFGDKILMLQSHSVYVTVNQVMVPDQFDELYTRMERFSKRGINVTLKPQSDLTASHIVNYTAAQLEIMQSGFPQKVHNTLVQQVKLFNGVQEYSIDQAERFNSYGFNQFKGWSCNSGFQSVIIRGNEVRRGYSCHDVPLGTLTEGFNLFAKPQICITPTCVSSADSKIPKCK